MTENDENYEERIEELCGKAGINSPFMFTSWLFMRAAGRNRQSSAHEIGISARSLKRYEGRAFEHLTTEERFELIRTGFLYEYDKRMKRGDTGQ